MKLTGPELTERRFIGTLSVIRTSFALWACDRGKEPPAVVKWIANNYGVSIDDE